jgi:hypothetical protein
VYSLTIIIFELFSGINPFPGHIGQIFQAKMSDKKPAIPSNFPSDLKDLVIQGWSKDQKKRPPIEDFKSALNKMLTSEGKDQSLTLLEEEQQLDFHKEVNSAEKTEEELSTTTKAGNPIKLFFTGDI